MVLPKLVRQLDESDCGPAAIATIALWHKMPVPIQTLRTYSGTDSEGTSLAGMLEAAETVGFSVRAIKTGWDVLQKLEGNCIAHTADNQGNGHYVVVHRVRRGRVQVADPARGMIWLKRGDFEALGLDA